MSDCGVCLYTDGDFDGMIDEAEIVTLGRNQKCSECRKIVPAGAPIERASFYEDWDDCEEDDVPEQRDPIYTCPICAEIADAFYCGEYGRVYGGDLWEGLYEVMGELTTSCFDRLKTPEAKAELQRRWAEWKFSR